MRLLPNPVLALLKNKPVGPFAGPTESFAVSPFVGYGMIIVLRTLPPV